MYLRAAHTELHIPSLYKFIHENPLGIFAIAISSPNYRTIQSSHIPWILDAVGENESGKLTAKLRGYLARADPQCKALIEAAAKASSSTLTEEVMILFNGPVHHYVTPKFYVESKPSTGKVVPTWNYSAVQVYGTATIFFDTSLPSTDAFISKAISDLSKQSEEREFGFTGENGRPKAWNLGEAPDSYVGLLKKAIIGVDIEIKDSGGKFKMSQELKDGDWNGVIQGFEKLGTDEGREITRTVKEREEVMTSGKA